MLYPKSILNSAFIVIVSFLTLTAGESEEEKQKEFIRYHSSFFTIGGTYLSLDKLNEDLGAIGYHGLNDYAVQIGGGFGWQVHRLMGGVELLGYGWQKEEQTPNVSRLYSLQGRINLGFNVLPTGASARLYPMAAFGTGRAWLNLGRKEAQFSEITAAPLNEVDIKQRSVVLSPGLGFDYAFSHKEHAKKSLQIGVRAGYAFDVSDKDDWYSDGVEITSAPELRTSGPYLRVTIGKLRTKTFYKSKECCKHVY